MRKLTIEIAAMLLLTAAIAYAHCDSLDGPVVQAARRALAAADVNVVLPWVQSRDEPAIRQAFARTLAVRKLNPEAEELADTWFFETLVRVHRAGEGAPFDGLKPAGTDVGPALAGADKAIETGDLQRLDTMLTGAVREGLRQRFARVRQAANYKPSDVNAGREYVAAYVDFIHFAERLHEAMAAGEHEQH
jgi:hypothetical protein